MKDADALPALLYKLHMNQLAIGAAVEELAIWVGQRGSIDTAQIVKSHLKQISDSSDDIADLIATLMAIE
ncbi:hypothetical protein MCB86_08980 [Pseudomonas sp. KSR10]|uniref:hypothetical protein n=1 Tax=Pseudomonas sp. KSR10 TaxID=2916654 RepID=UPI001EF92B29|nr:hypothetical protein [Pseudomonas sp. KSR10]MCG6540207.1 hypothetical protein [Pseudomonas sp. KSR10]